MRVQWWKHFAEVAYGIGNISRIGSCLMSRRFCRLERPELALPQQLRLALSFNLVAMHQSIRRANFDVIDV